MPLGLLSYTAFAALVGGSLFLPSPDTIPPTSNQRVTLGYSTKSVPGSSVVLSYDRLLERQLIPRFGIHPYWGAGASAKGMTYVTAGLSKTFEWDRVSVTPYIGPALYADRFWKPTIAGLLQFRSGVDVGIKVGPKTRAGIGFYHISNAGITSQSAGQDVLNASLTFLY